MRGWDVYLKSALCVLLLVVVLGLSVNGCESAPAPDTTQPTTAVATLSTTSLSTTTLPSVPEGRSIIVTSADDGGPGTLRQALVSAQARDIITFDPKVFPPTDPTTIHVATELPLIEQDYLTIDGSNAGVILDGSEIPEGAWECGLQMVSDGNTVQGLQVVNFPGAGISVSGGRHNTIGGDRTVGSGPLGQGNLVGGNDEGIGLWGEGASDNTVAGNLVGVGADGSPFPNRNSGVLIQEAAHSSVIGPNNQIAFNGNHGIYILYVGSVGNAIVGNSIHDNGGDGINLAEGGNEDAVAPELIEFDLAVGYANGLASPNCEVQVYSDAGGEGAQLEAETITDAEGHFVIEKGSMFAGPALTATVTDQKGNTSAFSTPTAGSRRVTAVQTGNQQPRVWLALSESQELPDNHIGVHFEGYDRYCDTEHVFANGFKWIRMLSLTDYWGDDDEVSRKGLPKTFRLESIPPEVDTVIDEYLAHDVAIVLSLWGGSGLPPVGTSFKSDAEVEALSEYVRFVVSHFKGRIQYYEIWNEPGDVAVGDYAALVRHVVPIIREVDPQAKVIIGAVPGTWEKDYPGYGDYWRFNLDVGYLNALLRSGVAPLVDGVSWHPFYGNVPNDPYYQGYAQMVEATKQLAAAQGFTGEYFAEEILWQTVDEEDFTQGPPVSPAIAVKYYARTITEHRGLGVNVIVNTFFVQDALRPIHYLCGVLAGAEPTQMALSVTSAATNVRRYVFVLPNGDRLVALWMNGEAAEHDPGVGVGVTVTIPGASAMKAFGVDVFGGFEQELLSTREGGDLVIRGFLLKDYPVFIRLSK